MKYIIAIALILAGLILGGEIIQEKQIEQLAKLEKDRQVLIIQRRILIQKYENLIQAVRREL